MTREEIAKKCNVPINMACCDYCLNSEPYVCDIIFCTEEKKPTNRQYVCDKYLREVKNDLL